jgi:hypothetical protein
MTEPRRRGRIVTLTIAVAATIATPAVIPILMVASSQSVVGAPMPRMVPEAVAEPRADRLAIDRFTPLELRPRVWRGSAPLAPGRSGVRGAPVDWRRQLDDPFQIDLENRKRLLWFRWD